MIFMHLQCATSECSSACFVLMWIWLKVFRVRDFLFVCFSCWILSWCQFLPLISCTHRLSQSEFIIPYWKFMRSFSQPFSVGMRFKLRYESEDASERRYYATAIIYLLWNGSAMVKIFLVHACFFIKKLFFRRTGIIIGSREADPMWHGSKWKCLVVCSLIYCFAQMDARISLIWCSTA